MKNPISRRRFVQSTLLSLLGAATVGCGTILHPERKGQPAGPLDTSVVLLDAIGLLFFFVPGVIAFAVDFNNGTIYLPPEHYGQNPGAEGNRQLVLHSVPKERLTLSGLEWAVSTHAKREVRLEPGQYRKQELKSIDDFWSTRDKLAAS